MATLEKFNQIEEKLIEIARSIPDVMDVTAAEEYSFRSPRVFVWIRMGESRDLTVSGTKREFRIRFEYVIDVVHPNRETAYETVKKIAWSLYDKLMEDRTLGGLARNVDPAPGFLRETLPVEEGYGHRWRMFVDVEVEI